MEAAATATDDDMPDVPDPQSESTETLAPGAWVRRADLHVSFVRSSGPGGQSVNKVSTSALLRVEVGAIRGLDDAARARLRRLAGQRLTKGDELVIRSQAHRSQADNRRACLERLRGLVTRARVEPIARRTVRPTRAMIRRRLEAKKRQSDKKRSRRTSRGRGDDAD